jgi:hypothetical protein
MGGSAVHPGPHGTVDIESRAAVGSDAEMATPPACTTHRRSVASPCRMLLFILSTSVNGSATGLGDRGMVVLRHVLGVLYKETRGNGGSRWPMVVLPART